MNQHCILFLLRSLPPALHSNRAALSEETKRIHRVVIRTEPYRGL